MHVELRSAFVPACINVLLAVWLARRYLSEETFRRQDRAVLLLVVPVGFATERFEQVRLFVKLSTHLPHLGTTLKIRSS
jgi:hypothetical protein